MASVAHFTVQDYDGKIHQYYRFGSAHPEEKAGIFANFPLGDRDFCIETFERRLRLEKADRNYFADVFYNMDLKTRHITVNSKAFVEDINFEGTFEEAIRRFADNNYSEREALKSFPRQSDISPILVPGFLDGLWKIVHSLKSSLSYIEYDIFTPRILYIGDNINFYMYQDFILFPSCMMNRNYKAVSDAYANARRIGIGIYFKNTINNNEFKLLYMLHVKPDGYILPLTGKFIRYKEGLDDKTSGEELAMLIKHIGSQDPKTLRAANYMYDIIPIKERNQLRESL